MTLLSAKFCAETEADDDGGCVRTGMLQHGAPARHFTTAWGGGGVWWETS